MFKCAASASAQSVEKEPPAILEIGGVGSWNVEGEGRSFGPTLAVEVAPIKKWLELEAGVTPLFARHSTEWDVDLLFKKPWEISKRLDFMLGVGPVWVHTNKSDSTRNSISVAVAPDFMFWPSGKPRLGWYIESSYEYNFGRGHEKSVSWVIEWHAEPGEHILRARATDETGEGQPDTVPFNRFGYTFGAIVNHPVTVQ